MNQPRTLAQNKTTYENTDTNAKSVGYPHATNGYPYCAEWCFGDQTAKFVTHDHVAGTFTFHD